MIAYEVYRDFSDEYHNDYVQYGIYLAKNKALDKLEEVIKQEIKEENLDREQMKELRNREVYEEHYVGYYAVDEIEIIE